MRSIGKELDETDKKIIRLLSRRHTYENVAELVFLSVDGVRYRLKVMKEHYEKDTIPELIEHLTENNLV